MLAPACQDLLDTSGARAALGRTVIDVAGQAGHSPETCLRYYALLFAEFDLGVRVSAEDLNRKGRFGRGWTLRGRRPR